MLKTLRGTTTVEVMIALVAMSLVLSASHGAKAALFHHYRDVVHRERAQLYAMETFEQLESIRLSRIQQNYIRSWESFLGDKESGYYQLVVGADLNQWQLVSLGSLAPGLVDEGLSVRLYEGDPLESARSRTGFYSRLERRIFLEQLDGDFERGQARVTVSVYWGLPGQYVPEHSQQIILQAIYADQTGPAFVL